MYDPWLDSVIIHSPAGKEHLSPLLSFLACGTHSGAT